MEKKRKVQKEKSIEWENPYGIEELLPIVAALSEKYTGMDSSSITYEKARQFMGAVIYCIRELFLWNEQSGTFLQSGLTGKKIPAKEAYRLGREKVLDKVRSSLALYNEIMRDFDSYGNIFLQDTMEKGMPEFDKWYDVDFAPQDIILTLDYPVLVDITFYEGIDAIDIYLKEIKKEQEFLQGYPRQEVLSRLENYHPDYRELVENLTFMFQNKTRVIPVK